MDEQIRNITDPSRHFSIILLNIKVTNNLYPFLKTLTSESKMNSSHFLRSCTSPDAKNPIWTFLIGPLNLKDQSVLDQVLLSDIKLGFTMNSRSLQQIEVKSSYREGTISHSV